MFVVPQKKKRGRKSKAEKLAEENAKLDALGHPESPIEEPKEDNNTLSKNQGSINFVKVKKSDITGNEPSQTFT